MPSTSAKQAKFMRAVAHSPKFAKKVGVPQSVGKDYEMADKKKKMKKFGDGGMTKKAKPPMPREPVTGGPNTVPLTPERKKFLAELERRNKQAKEDAAKTAKKATPYAKGGKVKKYAAGSKADEMVAKANRDIESMKKNAARFAPKAGDKPAARRPQAGIPLRPKMPGRGAPSSYTINPRRPLGQSAPTQAVMPTPSNTMDRLYADFQSQRNMGSQTPPPTPTQSQMQSQMGNAGQAAGSLTGATMKKGGKVMKKATKAGKAMVKKSADTMGRAMVKKNKGGSCYAGGGLVAGHKSADGIAKKGKTKGKMC